MDGLSQRGARPGRQAGMTSRAPQPASEPGDLGAGHGRVWNGMYGTVTSARFMPLCESSQCVYLSFLRTARPTTCPRQGTGGREKRSRMKMFRTWIGIRGVLDVTEYVRTCWDRIGLVVTAFLRGSKRPTNPLRSVPDQSSMLNQKGCETVTTPQNNTHRGVYQTANVASAEHVRNSCPYRYLF